jgi:hypothetical protein
MKKSISYIMNSSTCKDIMNSSTSKNAGEEAGGNEGDSINTSIKNGRAPAE